jgi:ATP-dependent helicase/nuclease subunit A
MKNIMNVYEHQYSNLSDNMQLDEEKDDLVKNLQTKTIKYKNEDEMNEIDKIFNWKYKYELAENIPTKTSVSKIKEEKNEKLEIKDFLEQHDDENNNIYQSNLNIPNFAKEQKITGAQKGTLIHLCIKNINEKITYTKNDIEELIQNMKSKGIITEAEANVININSLLQYTKSNLYNEIANAKEVHKEEPFYINMSASNIYNYDDEIVKEKVLVQGIIDLYYIDKNDKLILVDFKTDYVENNNEDILVQKYKEQLNIYKQALEKALNRKVDKTIIYSIFLQKEIEI